MSNSLPPELSQFVQQEIANGRYQSEAEVICHGLRLLRDREHRREQLHDAVNQGIDQLDAGEFTEYGDDSLRERFEQAKCDGRKRLAEREAGQ